VQKKKVSALSFELKNPDHMQFAQNYLARVGSKGFDVLPNRSKESCREYS
jgi:hypothetical protein